VKIAVVVWWTVVSCSPGAPTVETTPPAKGRTVSDATDGGSAVAATSHLLIPYEITDPKPSSAEHCSPQDHAAPANAHGACACSSRASFWSRRWGRPSAKRRHRGSLQQPAA